MIQNLEGDGFTMVPFGQGFASMSNPTKDFYRLLMEGKIIHGGHLKENDTITKMELMRILNENAPKDESNRFQQLTIAKKKQGDEG